MSSLHLYNTIYYNTKYFLKSTDQSERQGEAHIALPGPAWLWERAYGASDKDSVAAGSFMSSVWGSVSAGPTTREGAFLHAPT